MINRYKILPIWFNWLIDKIIFNKSIIYMNVMYDIRLRKDKSDLEGMDRYLKK